MELNQIIFKNNKDLNMEYIHYMIRNKFVFYIKLEHKKNRELGNDKNEKNELFYQRTQS